MAVMCSYSGDKMSLALGLVPRLMFYGFDFFFFFFNSVYHACGDEYLMLFSLYFCLWFFILFLQFCLMVILLQVCMAESLSFPVFTLSLVLCICFDFPSCLLADYTHNVYHS